MDTAINPNVYITEGMILIAEHIHNKLKTKHRIQAGFITFGGIDTGIIKVGMFIRSNNYWPVTKGTIVNGVDHVPTVLPEDGVIMRIVHKDQNNKAIRRERGFRYIKNSFYDEHYKTD
jgi:hypothetical protein